MGRPFRFHWKAGAGVPVASTPNVKDWPIITTCRGAETLVMTGRDCAIVSDTAAHRNSNTNRSGKALIGNYP
jgi:hypothetical protein